MTLQKIRKVYEQNYQKMLEIITEMGGEKNIKYHREKKTPLFRKLRELQRVEHRLSDMESHLAENE